MVRDDGSILEIGIISTQPVVASLGQAVKKSGRTSGLTRSTISGLNATVSVLYENECAGGTAFTKVFTGQIVIKNTGSKFIAAGDSGSLMVEDAKQSLTRWDFFTPGAAPLRLPTPSGRFDVLRCDNGRPIKARKV